LIANQTIGKGFAGALKYLLGKEEALIIGGNMVGETPSELSKEFSVSRALKPNLKRAVYHVSLSLPHGEQLSTSKWNEVAGKYVQKMGFSGSQFLVAKHNDTQHSHIHILASRVRLDGSVVSDSQNYKRSEKIVRSLEIEHNLTRVISSREVGTKALTKGELHKVLRENIPSTKMRLQKIINEATIDRPNADVFAKRLAKQGVEIIPNKSKTGHVSGISFELNGEKMKGSDLGRSYSWKNLTERKLNYETTKQNSKSISSRSYFNRKRGNGRKDDHSSIRKSYNIIFSFGVRKPSRENQPHNGRFKQANKAPFRGVEKRNSFFERMGRQCNSFENINTGFGQKIKRDIKRNTRQFKDVRNIFKQDRSKYEKDDKAYRSSQNNTNKHVFLYFGSSDGSLLSSKQLLNALFEIKEAKEKKVKQAKIQLFVKAKNREKSRSKERGFSLDIGF